MSLNNEPELIEPHNQIKLEKIKKNYRIRYFQSLKHFKYHFY
jgi:hypothetical protein